MIAFLLSAAVGFVDVGHGVGVAERPVSVGEFVAFLNESGAPYVAPPGDATNFSLVGDRYVADVGQSELPVLGLDWISAARYVNWLNSCDTESGAYKLDGARVQYFKALGYIDWNLLPIPPAAQTRTPGAR